MIQINVYKSNRMVKALGINVMDISVKLSKIPAHPLSWHYFLFMVLVENIEKLKL